MRIYRGYKFRLYPNREQEEQLRKIFAAAHFTYNRLLIQWAEQSGMDFQKGLDELIRDNPWLAFINRSILMHEIANLEKSCRNNLREYGPLPKGTEELLLITGNTETAPPSEDMIHALRENGKKAGRRLPRFKTVKDEKETFTITARNDIYIRYNRLFLGGQRGLKPIRVVQSRTLPRGSRICSATVSRERGGVYHVSLLCSINTDVDPDAWKSTVRYVNGMPTVGLNHSAKEFFIASDSYLRPEAAYLNGVRINMEKLASARERLSGMQKGSANYEKQRVRISRIQRNALNQRNDYLQKLSTQITDRYDIVCVEAPVLTARGVSRRRFPGQTEDDGWGEFVHMLEYKLCERGKKLIRVGERFPAYRRCHECFYINRDLNSADPEWICPVCGIRHNRDINASLNIRDEGIRMLLQQEKSRLSTGSNAGRRNGADSEDATRDYPYDRTGNFSTGRMVHGGMRSIVAADDMRVYSAGEGYRREVDGFHAMHELSAEDAASLPPEEFSS